MFSANAIRINARADIGQDPCQKQACLIYQGQHLRRFPLTFHTNRGNFHIGSIEMPIVFHANRGNFHIGSIEMPIVSNGCRCRRSPARWTRSKTRASTQRDLPNHGRASLGNTPDSTKYYSEFQLSLKRLSRMDD